MLSRTADSLYWLSRYTERADLVARILDATIRLASLPSGYGGERNEWESAVAVAGNLDGFRRKPQPYALCHLSHLLAGARLHVLAQPNC